MSTNVSLPPALERFTRKCVKSGRYSNVSEVVRSALRLLQETEARRERFETTLREAEAEADRVGTRTVDEVAATLDKVLDRRRR